VGTWEVREDGKGGGGREWRRLTVTPPTVLPAVFPTSLTVSVTPPRRPEMGVSNILYILTVKENREGLSVSMSIWLTRHIDVDLRV
jgi:hypothetical protein